MKRNIYLSVAAIASALLLSACQITEVSDSQKTRSITVYPENVDTKTTIEYEYSDYSHLVWSEGDVVAYVTDCASDVIRTAQVSEGGYFTAEIPEAADTDNRLYVVYPGNGLAGGTLSGLSLEVAAQQAQDSVNAVNSTGIVIPMMAGAQVPEAGETSVSVRYNVPVSVIRFAFNTADFPQDQIKSVTFTASQPVAGTIDVAESVDGEVAFNGTSNSVTTTITKVSPLEKGGYVYVPVMRGSYSGVTMEVITDNNKFVFRDGNFELDDPDATLYKVEMTLGETQVIKDPYFAEISEGEQFSADNKYLLAYKESSSSYRVASKPVSSKIDAKMFNIDSEIGGIPAKGEVMDYVFTITPMTEISGKTYYSLYSSVIGISKKGGYMGLAATTKAEGNIFYFDTYYDNDGDGIPDADDLQFILSIENENGTWYIHNDVYKDSYDNYFKYSTNLNYFVSSNVGRDNTGNEEIKDITILKLIE